MVATTSETRTASLARRIVRAALQPDGVDLPRLVVVSGLNQAPPLELPEAPARVTVGSALDADLPLPNVSDSEWVLEIEADLDGYVARSLGDAVLRVGAAPVHEKRIRSGDELGIEDVVLRFDDPAETQVLALGQEGEHRVEAPVSPAPRPSEPEPNDTPQEGTKHQKPGPSGRDRRRPGMPSTDLVIYALAGAVFVLSIAALMVLLQS